MSIELLNELEKVEVLWETLESKLPQVISNLEKRPNTTQEALLNCYRDRLGLVRQLSKHIRDINDDLSGMMESGNARLAAKIRKLKASNGPEDRFLHTRYEPDGTRVDHEFQGDLAESARRYFWEKENPGQEYPGPSQIIPWKEKIPNKEYKEEGFFSGVLEGMKEGILLAGLTFLAMSTLAAAGLWVHGKISKNKQLSNIKQVKVQLLKHAEAMNTLADVVASSKVKQYIQDLRELNQSLDLEERLILNTSAFTY